VSTPEDIAASLLAKARAELDAADALLPDPGTVARRGGPDAAVLLIKGTPDAADAAAGHALAGADGQAAIKALASMGLGDAERLAMLSRPAGAVEQPERLARYIAASDPRWVVALDGEAAEDLAVALGVRRLAFGRPLDRDGRRFLAVDGLAACLDDAARKRLVWAQLRTLAGPDAAPEGE
jgi:hypothetical protein